MQLLCMALERATPPGAIFLVILSDEHGGKNTYKGNAALEDLAKICVDTARTIQRDAQAEN